MKWTVQGYQWYCIEGGEGCGDESGGGFESRPFKEMELEAMHHHETTGHAVQIDELRLWRYPPFPKVAS